MQGATFASYRFDGWHPLRLELVRERVVKTVPQLAAMTPAVTLGTADDTEAIKTIVSRAKGQAQFYWNQGKRFQLVWPEQYICEGTLDSHNTADSAVKFTGDYYGLENVGPGGVKALTLGPDGQGGYGDPSAANTDALGNAVDRQYRDRALVEVINASRVSFLAGFTTSGPHPETGRGRSINSVLEGQHGFWLKTSKDIVIQDVDIDHVWGDFVSLMQTVPYEDQCERVLIEGGTWRRNGREGVLLNACSDFIWRGTKLELCTSTILHSETGSGTTGPVNRRWLIESLADINTGQYFVHWTGGAAIEDVIIRDIHRLNGPVSLYMGPTGRTKRFAMYRTSWTRPQDGGYIWNLSHVDDIDLHDNSGPARKIQAITDQIKFTDCTNPSTASAVLPFNNIWLPA